MAEANSEQARLEREFLRVVEEFAREVHPKRQIGVTLDSSIDRDLAIDSLGRVELLHRIERRLQLVFPEDVAFAADTPADLLAVAKRASVGPGVTPPSPLAPTALDDLPREVATLPEVLRWHADRHPERVLVQLLEEDAVHTLTCGQLLEGATRVAAGLRASDLLPGESVAIMLPTSLDYFLALHGVLLAGGVPVPVYPPARLSQIEEHVRRQVRILGTAEARVMITVESVGRLRSVLMGHLPFLRAVVTVAELQARGEQPVQLTLRSDDVALLQFTSGSTGDPKGVVLTHANLLANVRSMGEAVQARSTDVFVSWLPLYHDMGLIGACLATLYHGCPLVLMSPVRFLTSPRRWLWAIHHYGGTLSAAPNFAYELCATRTSDEDVAGLDLSSWRIAFNGAEPVHPDTIDRFVERFEPHGFRAETMLPVYGLAESSVGLAFPDTGQLTKVDRIQRETFVRWRRAEPEPVGAGSLSFVCCGHPLPGHELRVVGTDGRELGEREEGRLQFRGPSATSGYHRNPAATSTLFDGDWLETGDNAYFAGGELYVTGRSKDLIIKAGRNIYPQELEAAVAEVSGVRKGCVAVFGSTDPQHQTERLVVVAESRAADSDAIEALRSKIVEAAADVIGIPPDVVLVVPPRSVPKTSSGKIRRSACRDLYERGELGGQRSVWWQFARLALAGVPGRLRRVGRALSDRVYAARAWGVVAILAPCVWLSILLLPVRSWRHQVTRLASRLGFWLAGVRLRKLGFDRLQGSGPWIFVANHASYLDTFALVAALPAGCAFAAKGELAGNPLLRWHLQLLGHVFVERFDHQRSLSDVDALAQAVKEGRSLVVFAEGTFVRAPGLRPFHMGAFAVSARTSTPVVPVAIRGSRSVLRGDQWFPRRGEISLTMSAPIPPQGDDWEESLRLRDQARSAILEGCGEPDLAVEPISLAPPPAP